MSPDCCNLDPSPRAALPTLIEVTFRPHSPHCCSFTAVIRDGGAERGVSFGQVGRLIANIGHVGNIGAVDAGPLASRSEPSSSNDDGGLRDGDSESSSHDDECSREGEQGRSSASKHSRWSDLDEQHLLAYKKEDKSREWIFRKFPGGTRAGT